MSNQAVQDIQSERARQDELWGEQNHGPILWLAILIEEVGEFAREILEKGPDDRFALREEAVQIAAVAQAIVECCDRNGWLDE